jgi:CRISPR-associated protein Cas2
MEPDYADDHGTDWQEALAHWIEQENAEKQAAAERAAMGWWEQAFCLRPTQSELAGHRCGEKQMLAIVAYDITDHKRLARVAKLCEDFGVRVQYSVFECRLESHRFDQFWNQLQGEIDPERDRIVAYKVCAACARAIRSGGSQTHYEKVVAYVF